MIDKYLVYNPETGDLTWIKRPANCIKLGSVVSSKTSDGYLAVCLKGVQYKAHRVAWYLHTGQWPEGQIDHINRIKTDNRIENLRVVTHSENQLNKKRGSSGELYVTKHPQGWQLRSYGGKSLGYYKTVEEAVAFRDKEKL